MKNISLRLVRTLQSSCALASARFGVFGASRFARFAIRTTLAQCPSSSLPFLPCRCRGAMYGSGRIDPCKGVIRGTRGRAASGPSARRREPDARVIIRAGGGPGLPRVRPGRPAPVRVRGADCSRFLRPPGGRMRGPARPRAATCMMGCPPSKGARLLPGGCGPTAIAAAARDRVGGGAGPPGPLAARWAPPAGEYAASRARSAIALLPPPPLLFCESMRGGSGV